MIGAVVVLLAGVVLAGGYVYYFSGLRSAPAPLALNSPLPAQASVAPSPAPAATAAAALPTGPWTVVSGSQAGYRVKEVFAGQTSSHEAVARTTTVGGTLTLSGMPGALVATSIRVVVGLGSLQSVDQVAGFNVANRDRIVNSTLNVRQFPEAVFEADSVPLPAEFEGGGVVSVAVPGRLTLHGVTAPVTAALKVQLAGGRVAVAGSIPTAMTAYGISPPALPITVVDPAVTVEVQVSFAPGP